MSVDIAELLPGQSIINPLKKVLTDCGLEVPDGPLEGEANKKPRSWLVRAESSKTPLVGAKKVLTPHAGQWASYGVFLGDCLTSLMFPDNGAYYVFKADDLSQEWLVIPSEEYGAKIQEIGSRNGLRLETISGGFKADAEIFRTYPVYQSRLGIVSLPSEVPVERAERILLTDGFLEEDELLLLPDSLRRKILPFLPYKLKA